MEQFDWALIPSFLAVAEHGSLSAAARATGQSQPTLGRHIRQLEDETGIELFHRRSRGLDLTEAGAGLIEAAQSMQAGAARFALSAAGQDSDLAGTVRITASVFVAHFLLPGVIARLRAAEPAIQIEIAASDTTDNLLYREADIAVRMYRPTQLDIIARQIGTLQLGLFASKPYLDRHGHPASLGEATSHSFVGYDRDQSIIEGMRHLGLEVTRDFFAVRCDAQAVYWELVRAGCGIGVGQVEVGERDPILHRVLPDVPISPLPVWLAAPEALRRTPRLRRVWDLLGEELGPLVS